MAPGNSPATVAISARFSLMCEVNQTPLPSSWAQASSISSDADRENRGVTA